MSCCKKKRKESNKDKNVKVKTKDSLFVRILLFIFIIIVMPIISLVMIGLIFKYFFIDGEINLTNTLIKFNKSFSKKKDVVEDDIDYDNINIVEKSD
jgi:hypothetical protein